MNYFEIKDNTIDESVIHEIRPFIIEKWRKYMTIFIGIFMLFFALYGSATPYESTRVITAFGFPLFIFSIIQVIRMPIIAEKRMLQTLEAIHTVSAKEESKVSERAESKAGEKVRFVHAP